MLVACCIWYAGWEHLFAERCQLRNERLTASYLDSLAQRLLVSTSLYEVSGVGMMHTMRLMFGDKVMHPESGPRGGALDAAWPSTPVAHLAYETDNHFATIHCPRT